MKVIISLESDNPEELSGIIQQLAKIFPKDIDISYDKHRLQQPYPYPDWVPRYLEFRESFLKTHHNRKDAIEVYFLLNWVKHEQKITFEQLYKELGIKYPTFNRWGYGHRTPRTKFLVKCLPWMNKRGYKINIEDYRRLCLKATEEKDA